MGFKDIINQEKVKKVILGQINSKKIPHAYLFLGQDGVGRKKTALGLAKLLNCQTISGQKNNESCEHCMPCSKINQGIHPDVKIINFTWQANLLDEDVEKQKSIKIKTIRALQHDVNLKPTESKWKIFIIESTETITLEAANSLLKTLEEPPEWTIIILLAKHKETLPSTIVSRTQILLFQPIPEKEISKYLVESKNLSESLAKSIASISEGSLSNALELIEDRSSIQESFWEDIKKSNMSSAEILAFSDTYAKNINEFLHELLAEAKNDFRKNPETYGNIIQQIIDSQKMLERNINPKFILDSLLLKINRLTNWRLTQ
ncbi:ATP-binding protein [Elusimicrobiota bacterium]